MWRRAPSVAESHQLVNDRHEKTINQFIHWEVSSEVINDRMGSKFGGYQ